MQQLVNWKNKVIYQIFPRSFYDANNDGNGDIKGIIAKIPYLQELGVDAIWLCPTYETNFADAGYDVIDYKTVWKQFGTLDDFKLMVSTAKAHNIDIIMDIVLNHVSDQHPWFKKACESPKNKEHNYFIWRDKPNKDEIDAESIFGGSAWEYVPNLKKYYFHLFAKEQIDLNWEHEDTIAAMADVIDFWYKIGVRGFRLDAIKHISKWFPEGKKSAYSWGPTVVKQLQKFNKVAFGGKPDAFVLGEASGISTQEMLRYGTGKEKVASNYYNFAWWWIGWGRQTGRNGYDANWDYRLFVENMAPFQSERKITPELMTNFLSNHDTSRAVSRWGDENIFWQESAKTLALMQLSIKGIPCICYGEEIGMLNPRFSNRSEFRDVDALNAYHLLVDEKNIYTEDEMTKYHNINSRDNCRTPMQWDHTINAGFNKGKTPWIKVGFNHEKINVAAQKSDPSSIWTFYQTAINLRKSHHYAHLLIDGSSEFKLLKNGVFEVKRTSENDGDAIYVFLNLTNKELAYELPKHDRILIHTWNDNKVSSKILRPFESVMVWIKNYQKSVKTQSNLAKAKVTTSKSKSQSTKGKKAEK